VLFRKEERDMREKLVRSDLVDCVLGLGPNLFYNSPMEACVLICRTQKPKAHRGKVLLIDAVNEIIREQAQSFLRSDHQERIFETYQTFRDVPGFAAVVDVSALSRQDFSLSIPLYVVRPNVATRSSTDQPPATLRDAWRAWKTDSEGFWSQMDAVTVMLDGLVEEEAKRD